jgi:hypothetical protein
MSGTSPSSTGASGEGQPSGSGPALPGEVGTRSGTTGATPDADMAVDAVVDAVAERIGTAGIGTEQLTLGGDGVVHEIQWSDALPWWLLFRAAGAAFSPTVIILGALGAIALWAGWSLADQMGLPGARVVPVVAGGAAPSAVRPLDGTAVLNTVSGALPAPAAAAVGQALTLFSPASTAGLMGGAAVRLAWFVLVWSLFGTAIARVVGLRLVGEERLGLAGSLRFAARMWPSPCNAALFTLLGMLALALPAMLLGLLMRADWGLAVAGLVWPLILAGGLVLAILAIGLVLGWPLMVAAVGVERGDSFQAISTSFSYLYQRPLHACFYILLALLVAVPALAAAAFVADATSGLALWAASFGMGHARTAGLLEAVASGGEAATFGARAIQFWTRGLEAVLGAFGWGYAWAIATAAYMLLRRDVDGTELDEIVDEIAAT